jgi:hypothetical protein
MFKMFLKEKAQDLIHELFYLFCSQPFERIKPLELIEQYCPSQKKLLPSSDRQSYDSRW